MKKILIIVFILLATPSFAEKLQLTSGLTVRGTFVRRAQDFVIVDTGLGVEVSFYFDEIESVDGEPFDEKMLKGVAEIPAEELKKLNARPEDQIELPEDIKEKPAPVQLENPDIEFKRVQEQANNEFEKGNINRAFKLVETIFEKCDDFQERRCLETFDLYLSIAVHSLAFIDEGGLYDKIDSYAKDFLDHIEPIGDLNNVIGRIDKIEEGQEDVQNSAYSRLFQVYAYYCLYLASKKDIEVAKTYMLKAGKFDPNFGKGLEGLIGAYEKLFSDKEVIAVYNALYDMQIRLSALTEAPVNIKVLYDRFQIDRSANEDRIIDQLAAQLDLVKNEVFGFKSKEDFNKKTLPLFVTLLDSETPEFLVWYFKNFAKQSPEIKKEMNERFKSSFVSMINYVLLKARGFDVYYVATWAKVPESRDPESGGSSILDLFGGKKTPGENVENSLCAVKISDKNFVFVDFLEHWISKKFILEDVYEKKGEIYYEMKPGIKHNDLYEHFQLSKGALVQANVISNLLLQMNRMGYPLQADNPSLKLAKMKNPHNRNGYHLLAYISFGEGKIADSINYLNMSLKAYNNDPQTNYLLGQFYYESRDYINSIESLNNALKIDPSLIGARLLLASNYYEIKDYGSALEEAQKCLKEKPNDPSVHIMLIQLYPSFGNIPAAKNHAREAIKLLKLQGETKRAADIAKYLESLQ